MDNRPGMPYCVPMKRFACVVSLVLCAFVRSVAQAASGADVFGLPIIQDRFSAIKRDLMAAVLAQDYGAMEDACRAGRALLPADPNFAYNLACALARQGKADAAFEMLREAVALGFRNADHIRRDADLASLHSSPAFAAVLKQAEPTPSADAPHGLYDATPTPVRPGGIAWVSSTNTVWDFDAALFRSVFVLSADSPRLAPADADAYRGPVQPLLAGWLREGRAAGNVGDLYDNRDDGHSALKVADFPGLARIVYGPEAASASNRPYYGAAQFIYNLPTFGNSSTALTQGPFWRCQARMLVCNPLRVGGLFNLYVSNHSYVYPSHQDYQAAQGDVFL